MLKFKIAFNTFRQASREWCWAILSFMTVGLFCFSLAYIHHDTRHTNTHYNPLPENSLPTPPIQRVAYALPRNFINKTQAKATISAKSTLAKETLSLAVPTLADDEGVVDESTEDVFFGCIKLVGTIVSMYNPLKSKAIIENRLTSRQRSYSRGSIIPYGARIIMIDKKGIMLEKQGVNRRLFLAEKLGDPADMAVLKSRGYMKIGKREWLITPNSLIKDTKHIYSLLREASIRPHFDSGRIGGFKVTGIKPGGLIKGLGLKDGDVITTVNGSAIDSIAGAYEIYQQIRYAPTIKLGLSRQQQEVSLAYHIIADGPPKYRVKDALGSPSIAKLFMDE